MRTLDAALAATLQLATGEATAASLPGATSPITGLSRVLIDAAPGPAVDVVVATAETADKRLLRSTVIAGWTAAVATSARSRSDVRTGALTMGALGAASAAAGLSRPEARPATSALAATAGACLGAAALAALRHRPTTRLRLAILASAATAVGVAKAGRSALDAALEASRRAITLPDPASPAPRPPDGGSFDVPGLSPLFTPPQRFYVTDVSSRAPRVDPRRWRLHVGGMVDRPLTLTLDDVLGMPLHELDATLVCVHNPVGGPRIGSARWLGVPLSELLDRVGVQDDAQQLVARSVDGFTAGVPVSRVQPPHAAILAVGMNGEPLTVSSGFPARLLVPGLWGADANTKWVCELELTTWGAVRDYWDRRGWPRQPSSVCPGARIDTPRHRDALAPGVVTLAGVAWAPPVGVDGVEVCIDDGPWLAAELSLALAPTLWRRWRLHWEAEPGGHRIRVRPLSGERAPDDEFAPPFPVGSRGQHTITVSVEAGAPGRTAVIAAGGARAVDDVRARAGLAAAALPAWRARGFPPAPRWPAPT